MKNNIICLIRLCPFLLIFFICGCGGYTGKERMEMAGKQIEEKNRLYLKREAMNDSILRSSIDTTDRKQDFTNYEGKWIDSGQDYENTLILEKIESSLDKYKFTFFGWRESFDHFTQQRIRFGGEMSNEIFTITVKNDQAYYDDDIRQFSDGESLYSDGEHRCAVLFLFEENNIVVKTANCERVYSGYNVLFDGVYEKFEN